MSDKLRHAAILPFLLAAAPTAQVAVPNEAALVETPVSVISPAELLVPPTAQVADANAFVGPYRLIRTIGSGGMGVVYLAESAAPVKRRVALKLMRPDSLSPAMAAQFHVEQQALATVEHDSVVRLFESGFASDGRPWFAMEYVDGEPITEFSDRRELDIDARLKLFEQVCRAVEHGHQSGVLHGDLKPANILVRESDGRPMPKIIDLGLAKVGTTEMGEPGALMGTLAYLAPEQLALTGAQRDERCDVYALGMVLRELLTGHHPGTEDRLSLSDVLDGPRAASERLHLLGATAEERAKRRGTRAARLRQRLHRGLDRIEARATAHAREKRYPSAKQLADDVAREVERESRRTARMRTAALVGSAAVVSFVGALLLAL